MHYSSSNKINSSSPFQSNDVVCRKTRNTFDACEKLDWDADVAGDGPQHVEHYQCKNLNFIKTPEFIIACHRRKKYTGFLSKVSSNQCQKIIRK